MRSVKVVNYTCNNCGKDYCIPEHIEKNKYKIECPICGSKSINKK